MKMLSLSEREGAVRRTFYQTFRDMGGTRLDVLDVYEDALIIMLYEQPVGYYRVTYTWGDPITFAERSAWEPVEKEWVARKMLTGDEQAFIGGAVKALGDGRVGGYLVSFGDAVKTDLTGEFFDGETDFVIDFGSAKSAVYFNHGLDPVMKRRVLGEGTLRKDDVGVWIEAQLSQRDAYEQAIYKLAEDGKLGWSSGSAPHLVERAPAGKATRITRWPLGLDASLTPTPAEYRNQVVPIKALTSDPLGPVVEPGDSTPEAPPEALAGAAGAGTKRAPLVQVTTHEENQVMPDNDASERMQALEQNVKGLSEQINKLLDTIEHSPAVNRAGYVADGPAAADHVKSFGNWLLAVQRNDVKTLHDVYGSVRRMDHPAYKDLGTTDGSAGGFLVPQEYSTALLKVAESVSPILQRVQTVPVGLPSGKYPALDNYTAVTAGTGATAKAAGVKATARAEGAALTETEPTFVELDWRVKEVGGYTEVNNELIRWSPTAVENLLRQLFGIAVAAKKEFQILRGNGSTQYLGILNSPAAIGISPDTDALFAYADMLEMKSRFKSYGGQASWLLHQGLIPDVGIFEIGTAGASVPQGVGTPSGLMTMPGTNDPIIYSEHLPQDDNSGCAILADLNAYLVFQNGTLEIAFSEHAAFTSNKGTWRFIDYSDGMPWVKSYITLADPQGSYTVSPFVYFND